MSLHERTRKIARSVVVIEVVVVIILHVFVKQELATVRGNIENILIVHILVFFLWFVNYCANLRIKLTQRLSI